MTLARGGDEQAFRRLVERHSRGVFQLAFRLTGSEPDAEDVVQEAFLKAFRELKRFEERSSFSTWLHRITANCAYDLLRRRPRHKAESLDTTAEDESPAIDVAADATTWPDRLAFSAEVQKRLQAAMGSLSPAERAAFVMRHVEGQSVSEIGAALGLHTSATKHSIFRAVQKMRRALGVLVVEGGQASWPVAGKTTG